MATTITRAAKQLTTVLPKIGAVPVRLGARLSSRTEASTPPCQLGPAPALTDISVNRWPRDQRSSNIARAPSTVYSVSRPIPSKNATHWNGVLGAEPIVRSSAIASPALNARISSSHTRVAHAVRVLASLGSTAIGVDEGLVAVALVDGPGTTTGESRSQPEMTRRIVSKQLRAT
jgi:hypothetical protein